MESVSDSPSSIIVRSVREIAGDLPVVLCGSRATGEADELSDWDIFVVVPMYKIPLSIGRLRAAAGRIEKSLREPVSINPLPSFRLRWPGRTLLEYKLREEGHVLYAPRWFKLERQPPLSLNDVRATSYALSGLRFLLAHLSPEDLGGPVLSDLQARDVRKALLHTLQLRLLDSGSYADRLSTAIDQLESSSPLGQQAKHLAQIAHLPEAWFVVRNLLMNDVRLAQSSRMRTFVSNTQYAALSLLTGGRRALWALAEHDDISDCLAKALVLISSALLPGGLVDERFVQQVHQVLPERLLSSHPAADWTALRDLIEEEWGSAAPLVGF
jgi:predicted nucleotidyltransferase